MDGYGMSVDAHFVSTFAPDPRFTQLMCLARNVGNDFSGMGLVFCEDKSAVPHVPLYTGLLAPPGVDACSFLVGLSTHSNPYHDGFHLLTPGWKLLAPGVFLAPPVTPDPVHNPENHGSRWVAALLTSRLPGVLACLTIIRAEGYATLFHAGKALSIQPCTPAMGNE